MKRDYQAALDSLIAFNCVFFSMHDCERLIDVKAGHLRGLNQVAKVEAGLHSIVSRFQHATVEAIKAESGLDVTIFDLYSTISRAQLQRKLTALMQIDREFAE